MRLNELIKENEHKKFMRMSWKQKYYLSISHTNSLIYNFRKDVNETVYEEDFLLYEKNGNFIGKYFLNEEDKISDDWDFYYRRQK